ncbi:MAG: heme-binding domain-containing protein [Bacteroidetes bacterium]|nr:heme-binding domain-containing protein [Bacteroidota bacterium]
MKQSLVLPVPIIFLFLVFQSFISNPPPGPEFPAEIEEVLEKSCNVCHSKDASNKKSALALNFSKWDDYKLTKRISKLDEICEVIKEGSMPPEKYLKGNPEKALSDEQKELVCNWAEEESAKLMEGN